MSETLRVGILGAGNAAQAHVAAYTRIPGVTVTALWNRTRARAEKMAASLNLVDAEIYDHWETLIEQAGVDIISVATPPLLRRVPVAAALNRGLHVLVEKEFTATLDDARALVDQAAHTNSVTAVSLNWRYSPGCQATRNAIQEGTIGQLLDIVIEERYRFTMSIGQFVGWVPWSGVPELGGGMLRQGGTHEFDRTRFLTGWEFTGVDARLAYWEGHPSITAERSYLMLAELTNRGLGSFRCSSIRGQQDWQTIITGDEGSLTLRSYNAGDATHEAVIRQRIDDPEPVEIELPARPDTSLLQYTWNRLIEDFITAIRRGDRTHTSVPHLPRFEDGLRVQEIIAAADKSNAERRWVELSELL